MISPENKFCFNCASKRVITPPPSLKEALEALDKFEKHSKEDVKKK